MLLETDRPMWLWLIDSTVRIINGQGGIIQERVRAHEKHADHSMESRPVLDLSRYTILVEEVGEVAKEFNDAAVEDRSVDLAKLRAELVQVAAMAVAWVAAVDREAQS